MLEGRKGLLMRSVFECGAVTNRDHLEFLQQRGNRIGPADAETGYEPAAGQPNESFERRHGDIEPDLRKRKRDGFEAMVAPLWCGAVA